MNSSFTFQNCIVKIEPGSQIIIWPNVINSVSLTIDNSKLFACENMWDGIVLNNNTSIHTKNNSVIEDAIIAIKANNKSNCDLIIEKTTFNRNDVGIYLSQQTNVTNPASISKLSKNTFQCTAPLNGTSDKISSYGIQINNNQVLSVNPISEANLNRFNGLKTGIFLEGYNSILNGKYFYFEYCKYAGIQTSITSGIQNSTTINLEASRFLNCGYAGIYVGSAVNIRLKGCRFDFTEGLINYGYQYHRFGIFVYEFKPSSKFSVTKCAFNATLTNRNKNVTGMYFPNARAGSETQISISNNTFNFIATWSFGIYIKGTFPSNSDIDIFNNTFDILQLSGDTLSFGIASFGGNKHNLDIVGNRFTNDGFRRELQGGIYLAGSEGNGNEFTDNNFPLPVVFNSFERGVYVQDFDNTKFCSNSFYNTLTGFYFTGQNDVTDITANDFHAVNMIDVEENSWTDEQNQKGNTWTLIPTFNFFANPQALNESIDFAQYSNFFIHTPQSSAYSGVGFYPHHPKDITPDVSNEWWQYIPGTPEGNCITQAAPGGGVTNLKMDIADNDFDDFGSDSSLIWQAKRGLYWTLKKNPDLINLYGPFSSFLNTHSNTAIGKLYNISNAIDEAITTGTNLNKVAGNQVIIDSLLLELLEIDSILEISLDSSTRIIKLQIVNQLLTLIDTINQVHDSYLQNLLELTEVLQLENDSNEWEADEKLFYSYYIDILRGDTLLEGQLDTLQQMAQKCPNSGGMAVYFANGLLQNCALVSVSMENIDCYDNESTVEIDTLQQKIPINSYEEGSHSVHQDVLVYPNPTSGEIRFNLLKDQPAYYFITDSYGSMLFQGKLFSNEPIDLSSLGSGLYIACVLLDDGSFINYKVTLLK